MRCGYLGFEEGLPGDHRTVWIDLPLEELFGHRPPNLHKVFPPDLVASDPRVCKKCNHKVALSLQKQGIIAAAQRLRQMVKENLANPTAPPHDGATVDALHLKINNVRRDTSWELAKGRSTQELIPFPPK